MTDCLYCKVAANPEGAQVLLTDDRAMAIVDPSPAHPGHVVVFPRAHVATLFDADEDTWNAVCDAVRATAVIMQSELGVEAVNLFHASGELAQQRIPHLAVHLVPRKKGDGLEHLTELAGKQTHKR